MPQAVRIVDRVQDMSDIPSSLQDGLFLMWDNDNNEFVQPNELYKQNNNIIVESKFQILQSSDDDEALFIDYTGQGRTAVNVNGGDLDVGGGRGCITTSGAIHIHGFGTMNDEDTEELDIHWEEPIGSYAIETHARGTGENRPLLIKSTGLTIEGHTASDLVMVIKGKPSQTANLMEWQNSAGDILTRITSVGNVGIRKVPTTTLDVNGNFQCGEESTNNNSGSWSAIIGRESTVTGDNSLSVGRGNIINGGGNMYAATFGRGNSISGVASVAIGQGNTTSSAATRSLAVGFNNSISGESSFAVGTNVHADSNFSYAFGRTIRAVGSYSIAYGLANNPNASATWSRVNGESSVGYFLGSHPNINLNASNTFAIFGGRMIINPNIPAVNNSADAVLELQKPSSGDIFGVTDISAGDLFLIKNDGNVGINTAAPTAQHQVHSSLSNKVTQIIRGASAQTANLTEWQNSAGAIGARITAAREFSNALDGGERFGAGATASASGATAIGANAIANSSSATAIGNNANAGATSSLALGAGATVAAGATSSIAISGVAANSNSVVVGSGASAASSAIAIGVGATGGATSIAIGGNANTTNGTSVAIGLNSNAGSGEAVSIGPSSDANSIGCIAIGYITTRNGHEQLIVMGRRAIANGSNRFIAGSTLAPLNDVFFGKGDINAVPTTYTINGTGGSGTNIVGGILKLAPGRSTGNATPSTVVIQSTTVGASGDALQALSDTLTVKNNRVGIGVADPTSRLNLAAGTTTIAPLKLTAGTNLTTPEAGSIEFDGTNLYFTDSGGTRRQLAVV